MIAKEKLVQMGAEKLADILIDFCQDSKDLKRQLDIIFAGQEATPQKMVDLINQAIERIKDDVDFLDHRETEVMAKQLEVLIELILELKDKSLLQTIDCLHAVLDLDEYLLERSEDRDAFLQGLLVWTCNELCGLYTESNLPIETIAHAIFNIFMQDGYGLYDDVIGNCKSVLGIEGLKLLSELFTNATISEKDKNQVQLGLDAIDACQKVSVCHENSEDEVVSF
jgi:hypothetical protein